MFGIGLAIQTLPSLAVIFLATCVAFLITATMMPAACRLAVRKGWVDKPDAVRKMHERATPTVGGIVVVIGAAFGLMFLITFRDRLPFEMVVLPPAFWFGAAIMIAVGIYDDLKSVSFKVKFGAQIFVAYLLLHAGMRLDISMLPFVGGDAYTHALYSMPLTMVWVVGVINAVNLIDGIDGLAAGTTIIALSSLGIMFGLQGEFSLIIVGLIVAAALLAFLLYNFNPASVFLGDAGSLFLGYVLAVLPLAGQASTDPLVALAIPAVVLGLPVTDTALSIVRRIAEKKAICAPDHDHIHHRMQRYFSKKVTVLVLYTVSMVFGAVAVVMSIVDAPVGIGLAAFTLVLTAGGLRALGYGRKAPAPRARRAVEHGMTLSRLTSVGPIMHALESGDGSHKGEVEISNRAV